MEQGKDSGPRSNGSRLNKITNFHAGLLTAHTSAERPNYRLCGWSSADSQLMRFSALVRAVDFQGGSVVDFGCGTGDLFGFLSAQGKTFTYLGLDMNETMLNLARASHAADFSLIDPDAVAFPPADYVFASGVFQFTDPDDPFYYRRLLGQLFGRCRVALGANFLSSSTAETERSLGGLYVHPGEVADLASRLSNHWLIDHSYHPGHRDMTLGVRVYRRA